MTGGAVHIEYAKLYLYSVVHTVVNCSFYNNSALSGVYVYV